VGSRDLLYRARLGVPWVTLGLVLTCLLVTIPLYFDPRRFYLTLGVDYCEVRGVVHWWHYVVAHFVHGTGCPFPTFPPITLHLAINVSLFVFQGIVVSLPFYLAWRKTWRSNLAAIAQGRAPDRGGPVGNAAGIAVAAAIFVFCAYFWLAAVVGWIRPVVL